MIIVSKGDHVQKLPRMEFGVPYGSRTRVAAVKGRCPRPLDERDAYGEQFVPYGKGVT